jgi:hypothetical protein
MSSALLSLTCGDKYTAMIRGDEALNASLRQFFRSVKLSTAAVFYPTFNASSALHFLQRIIA